MPQPTCMQVLYVKWCTHSLHSVFARSLPWIKNTQFEFEDVKPGSGGLTVYLLKTISHLDGRCSSSPCCSRVSCLCWASASAEGTLGSGTQPLPAFLQGSPVPPVPGGGADNLGYPGRVRWMLR